MVVGEEGEGRGKRRKQSHISIDDDETESEDEGPVRRRAVLGQEDEEGEEEWEEGHTTSERQTSTERQVLSEEEVEVVERFEGAGEEGLSQGSQADTAQWAAILDLVDDLEDSLTEDEATRLRMLVLDKVREGGKEGREHHPSPMPMHCPAYLHMS